MAEKDKDVREKLIGCLELFKQDPALKKELNEVIAAFKDAPKPITDSVALSNFLKFNLFEKMPGLIDQNSTNETAVIKLIEFCLELTPPTLEPTPPRPTFKR